MIARTHTPGDKNDIWAQLAAPLDPSCIAWRQDGRPTQREGKYFARFVCYVEAGTVRERLDAVIPGEWDLTYELLPVSADTEGESLIAFKGRLQVLGVIREDVGQGKDYKQAATDAFKRAAVRFGIGHELYDMDQLWVQVDGDGKFAKPLEDPGVVYARKSGKASEGEQRARPTVGANAATAGSSTNGGAASPSTNSRETPTSSGSTTPSTVPADEPVCPECGGRMWNNIATKRNPKAPDYACRDKTCKGVIWPVRSNTQKPTFTQPEEHGYPPSDDLRELPF